MAGDKNIGQVRSVMRTGATEILVIGDADGKERMVPLAESIVSRKNSGKIVMISKRNIAQRPTTPITLRAGQ
jgi:ribosomal 30S subunit maturation factor RimM